MKQTDLVTGGSVTVNPLTKVSAHATAPFTQADGETSSLTGQLGNVTATHQMAIKWKRSEFAALYPEMAGPAAVIDRTFADAMWVAALPKANEHGFFGGAPDLLVVNANKDRTRDVNLAAIPFGNPFPSTWGLLASANGQVFASYQVPGLLTTSPARVYATSWGITDSFATLAAMSASPGGIIPTLGPARNIKIGGRSALQDMAGIGNTPTLSWDPPAFGSPTYYRVVVNKLVRSGLTASLIRNAWRVNVPANRTSVQLPPNVVVSDGAWYVFNVTSLYEPQKDIDMRPYRAVLTSHSTPAVTAKFLP